MVVADPGPEPGAGGGYAGVYSDDVNNEESADTWGQYDSSMWGAPGMQQQQSQQGHYSQYDRSYQPQLAHQHEQYGTSWLKGALPPGRAASTAQQSMSEGHAGHWDVWRMATAAAAAHAHARDYSHATENYGAPQSWQDAGNDHETYGEREEAAEQHSAWTQWRREEEEDWQEATSADWSAWSHGASGFGSSLDTSTTAATLSSHARDTLADSSATAASANEELDEGEREAEELRNQMSSAVQNFLLGLDEEEGSENGDDDTQKPTPSADTASVGMQQEYSHSGSWSNGGSCGGDGPRGVAVGSGGGHEYSVASGANAAAANFIPGIPWAAAAAHMGAAAAAAALHMQGVPPPPPPLPYPKSAGLKPGFSQPSLESLLRDSTEKVDVPAKGAHRTMANAAAPTSAQGGQRRSQGLVDSGPSPEGVQDFLSVLRRRRLPQELEGVEAKHRDLVLGCVQSLYQDRIQPTQGQVQRRLRERGVNESTVQALLPLCARFPQTFRILPPVNGEQPVFLLESEPPWFKGWVDPQVPDEQYTPEVWAAVRLMLVEPGLTLSSHPNRAAEEIRLMRRPALRNLSLAEIEHIVRLSLGRKKLLEHHGDRLRPTHALLATAASQQTAKRGAGAASEQAVAAEPPSVPPPPPPPMLSGLPEGSDTNDVSKVLSHLMKNSPNGLPISSLKQYMWKQCQVDLTEPTVKCEHLHDLFLKSPLSVSLGAENEGQAGGATAPRVKAGFRH